MRSLDERGRHAIHGNWHVSGLARAVTGPNPRTEDRRCNGECTGSRADRDAARVGHPFHGHGHAAVPLRVISEFSDKGFAPQSSAESDRETGRIGLDQRWKFGLATENPAQTSAQQAAKRRRLVPLFLLDLLQGDDDRQSERGIEAR